ncbi:MAG: VOC family protein [Crocinitomicaceae bacterium]|nr:VOC family protein [Crocinitomicaceae bacterium]
MREVEFILYVADQRKSTVFYSELLGMQPVLDVPGMTEFRFSDHCKLGLMPEKGIAKIITPTLHHPELGTGIPRCELYLKMDNAAECYQRGVQIGAKEISPMESRGWGDTVGYLADFDGHVLAFAKKT